MKREEHTYDVMTENGPVAVHGVADIDTSNPSARFLDGEGELVAVFRSPEAIIRRDSDEPRECFRRAMEAVWAMGDRRD